MSTVSLISESSQEVSQYMNRQVRREGVRGEGRERVRGKEGVRGEGGSEGGREGMKEKTWRIHFFPRFHRLHQHLLLVTIG